MISRLSHLTYKRFMKFLIAPESSNVMVSALLLSECMNNCSVIDFCAEINTLDAILLLIKAKLIRLRENPVDVGG